MNYPLFNSDYLIYKLNQANNLYVAIPQAFARIIRQYVMEYQSLLLVPADKKVRGIVLSDLHSFKNQAEAHGFQSIDISINQLRFDS